MTMCFKIVVYIGDLFRFSFVCVVPGQSVQEPPAYTHTLKTGCASVF